MSFFLFSGRRMLFVGKVCILNHSVYINPNSKNVGIQWDIPINLLNNFSQWWCFHFGFASSNAISNWSLCWINIGSVGFISFNCFFASTTSWRSWELRASNAHDIARSHLPAASSLSILIECSVSCATFWSPVLQIALARKLLLIRSLESWCSACMNWRLLHVFQDFHNSLQGVLVNRLYIMVGMFMVKFVNKLSRFCDCFFDIFAIVCNRAKEF